MWHLYLDESGDLGFDFVNKKPSKFFTIVIMVVKGQVHNRKLINAVKHTLKRKLKKDIKKETVELKGTKTSFEIKQYFYQKACDIPFEIYGLTLNKRRLFQHLIEKKKRVYNFIAHLVLKQIPFEHAGIAVELVVDKSKSRPEIADFNAYIINQLQGRIDPKVPLHVYHRCSHESLGLQAVDLFTWGIFRKYEKKDVQWMEIFKSKIRYDDVYLPEKK